MESITLIPPPVKSGTRPHRSRKVIDPLPPHSLEAEQGIIGCILLKPKECMALIRERDVHPEEFYVLANRTIFELFFEMDNRGEAIDPYTVQQRLKDHNELDAVGGAAHVSSLPDRTPCADNLDDYINLLREKSIRRATETLMQETRDALSEHPADKAPSIIANLGNAATALAEKADVRSQDPAPVGIGELCAPSAEDELICYRFLCRGGSLAFIGQTGIGKSSLTMQMAICWALGRECFGFKPQGPLRSLIVQAENDEGDLFEMREGIFQGLELSDAERQQVNANVEIVTINGASGFQFINQLRKLLTRTPRDLVWIDPYYAYIGGGVSNQEHSTQFLRTWLAPVLRDTNCAAIIVHHPPKPAKEDGKAERKLNEYAYAGAGSVELANWARGVIYLEPTKDVGVFRLILGKRGSRVGLVEADGHTRAYSRLIAHGQGGLIYWRDANESETRSAVIAKRGFSKEDILPHVPVSGAIAKAALRSRCTGAGCAVNRFNGYLDEHLEAGILHEWRFKRSRTNSLIKIGRKPQPLGEELAV
jgi:hypothetical protein